MCKYTAPFLSIHYYFSSLYYSHSHIQQYNSITLPNHSRRIETGASGWNCHYRSITHGSSVGRSSGGSSGSPAPQIHEPLLLVGSEVGDGKDEAEVGEGHVPRLLSANYYSITCC